MDQNDETKKAPGSQTTFKGFGIEFSGPPWVAIAVLAAAVIGAAIYFSNGGSADQEGQEVAASNDTEEPSPASSHEESAPAETSTQTSDESASATNEDSK